MSNKNNKSILSKNGVSTLFNVQDKSPVTVQVIFVTKSEKFCFLRVSDGKHVSPVVAIVLSKFEAAFSEGAVILIQEAGLEPLDFHKDYEGDSEYLLDTEIFPLIITKYSLVQDHSEAGGLLSLSLPHTHSYKEEIKHIIPNLKKFDHNFKYIDKNDKKGQEESESLRERGNDYNKKNQYVNAVIHYDLGKYLDPFDYRLWSNASKAHFELSEYEQSEREAVIALKLNPFNEKVYYRLGQAALKQDRYSLAKHWCSTGQYFLGAQKELQNMVDEVNKVTEEKKLTENKDNKGRNKKKKGGVVSGGIGDEENIDPNAETRPNIMDNDHNSKRISEESKKQTKENEKNKKAQKSKEEVLKERKLKEEKLLEEERLKQETQLQDREPRSKNSYHESLKSARRLYETRNYQQALDMFGKVIAYGCPGGDDTEEKGYSGRQDLLEMQFIVGACKVQANMKDILDGMDMMRIFSSGGTACRASASAHYFIAIAYEKLCLNQMAQSKSFECSSVLKQQQHKAFKWPGYDDVFPESDPDRLKVWNDELYKRNKVPYPEEQSIATWKELPIDPSLIKKLDTYTDFQAKHSYMELIVRTCIVKKKRDFMGMFCRGAHSDYAAAFSAVIPKGHLIGKAEDIKPTANAKCRFINCISTQGHAYAKEEIFDTDPDFKGYTDVICEESCIVSYHPCCWKAHKESLEDLFGKMSDKDFLGTECVTPDCSGKISKILIYDEMGNTKHTLDANKSDKNAATPVKQKKKKDKKKTQPPKPQPDPKEKKKPKADTTTEDVGAEEAAAAAAPAPSKSTNESQSSVKEKASAPPAAVSNLPIDPESLNQATVVIKPTVEEDLVPQSKNAKKKKKNKKPKELIQPDLLGDPLEAEESHENEYVSRLRLLRQQKEAQEAESQNKPKSSDGRPAQLGAFDISKCLDPENPFYLPQHLRDNPQELERILQTKMISSSSPNLDNHTITTLLEFVYEWLKVEGPMSINDDRLRQYVAENFPREALDHVNQCGGIKQFLMQSIDFAMIDEVICVRDHVIRAQELTKKSVTERMLSSRFLISDGLKAKKFTHLLDDTKSTTSSSSSSQRVGSAVSSYTSRTTSDSNILMPKPQVAEPVLQEVNTFPVKTKGAMGESIGDLDSFTDLPLKANIDNKPKPAPKSGLNGLDTFEIPPVRGPRPSVSDSADSNDVGEERKEKKEDKPVFDNKDLKIMQEKTPSKIANSVVKDGSSVKNLKTPVKAGNETNVSSPKVAKYDSPAKQSEKLSMVKRNILSSPVISEQQNGHIYESEEEDDDYVEELEEEIEEEDATQKYIESLKESIESYKRGMDMLNEQNQKLNDKLIQVKSTTGIEITSLKQKIDDLGKEKRSLELDRHNLYASRESETKKFKAEMLRMQEEVKSFQGRHASLELKYERSIDRNNELEAKLVEEQEVSSQLREEVKNLQESLTSSSRRAHEAEVKYLCIKKDLSETHLNRTIERLTTEVFRMRQLLQHASDDSIPDRATLSRSIIAWDETIKGLRDRKNNFMEDAKRLLTMVNQGRPLNALPPGDLNIPVISDINVASLLVIVPNAKKPPVVAPPPAAAEIASEQHLIRRNGSPLLPTPSASPAPTQFLVDPHKMPVAMPKTGPPGFEAQKHVVSKPSAPTQPAFNSGAVPKATSNAASLSSLSPITTAESNANHQKYPDSHSLFVGRIPWEYTPPDVKRLFNELIGEVVGVTMYDKGFTADGKPVPKYGFVTFRNADDREKALKCGPIMIGNHTINIQPKETKRVMKPLTLGPSNAVNEQPLLKGGPSAYGLSDISLNTTSEANKSVTGNMPTQAMHQSITTKPKFQNLTSSNPGGTIGTPPPKLVRPQPKQPTNAKGGNQANAAAAVTASSKEDSSAYKRLMEICKQRIGKEHSPSDISNALREVRMKNSNSLSGLNVDEIVERVRQRLKARRPGAGQATVAPWAGLTQGTGGKSHVPEWQGPASGELPPEEQCSICLDALNLSPTIQLQCQHVFHEKCIQGWLKRQHNCPNCRTYALMDDEYPSLKH